MSSVFTVVSFDLENAKADDYAAFYEGLSKIGLSSKLRHINKSIVDLPSTTVAGSVMASDSSEAVSKAEIKLTALYITRKLKGKYFVFSGGSNWAWNGKSVTN